MTEQVPLTKRQLLYTKIFIGISVVVIGICFVSEDWYRYTFAKTALFNHLEHISYHYIVFPMVAFLIVMTPVICVWELLQ